MTKLEHRDGAPSPAPAHSGPISPEQLRLVQLVGQSGLYDGPWYLETYGRDIPPGMAPILHLLVHGRHGAFNPGPGFDARYYLDHNPDVAENGVHPLLHYILHGRREGRHSRPVPMLLSPENLDPKDKRTQSLIENSGLFDAGWYAQANRDVRETGRDPVEHYIAAGAAELRRPSWWFDPEYYFQRHPELAATSVNLLAHYVLQAPGRAVAPNALLEAAFEKRPGSGPTTAGDVYLEPARVAEPASLWATYGEVSAADGVLRIGGVVLGRFDRTKSAAPGANALEMFCRLAGFPTEPRLAADAAARPGLAITDAWFADDSLLRLRLGDGPAGSVLRGFQPSPGAGLAFVGETCIGAQVLCVADLRLSNPLMPLLLVRTTAAGIIEDFELLAFPSLCRGGWHHAELQAAGGAVDFTGVAASSRSLLDLHLAAEGKPRFQLLSDPSAATGAEPLHSPWMADWLARIFGRQVAALGGAASGPWLRLPPAFIPTLGALCAGAEPGDRARPADHLLLEPDGGSRGWAVAFPAVGAGLPEAAFDAVERPVVAGRAARSGYLAIGKADPAERATPTRLIPNSARRQTRAGRGPASVAALVVEHPDRPVADQIAALAAQSAAGALRHVVVAARDASCRPLVEHLFAGRNTVIEAPAQADAAWLASTLGAAEAEWVLLLQNCAALHDPRSLEALLELCADPRVFSAGCAIVDLAPGRELAIAGEFGGYVVEGRDGAVRALDDLTPAPGAYPVAANGLDAVLLRAGPAAEILRRLADAGEETAIRLGLAAAADGHLNLCTSGVRASAPARAGRPPPPRVTPSQRPPSLMLDRFGA